MFYDLNVAWSPSTPPEKLLQLLILASSLGYDTVALNHTPTLPLPATVTAPFPTAAQLTALQSTAAAAGSLTKKLPTILHRATFPLADPAAPSYRLPALIPAYDVLAVRPLTDKAFQNACLTLDVPVISLDLTQHFPFHFRPKPCMAAVARGVRFEICYGQALAADARARANFIGNVASLIRATSGRGLMLSSEARDALSLRAPADVVNLLSVWGLANDKGLLGVGAIPRSVVVNEGMKRTGFRGVVNVIQSVKRDEVPGEEAGSKQAEGGKKGKTKNKNKGPKQNQSQNQNQKRKSGDADTPSGAADRQAKKIKMAARGAGPDKE